MKLPLNHLLVLLCSAGLFVAPRRHVCQKSGDRACRLRSCRTTTGNPRSTATRPLSSPPAYTAAQIDQWVAPIALYPDALPSQF